jgi:hypothetical protein
MKYILGEGFFCYCLGWTTVNLPLCDPLTLETLIQINVHTK